ncbi:MAG: endonuclease/exonuclease/phosphatase family protein [Vicinamibacterales bacterium]
MTLRILSYNIRHGGSGREAALADVIRAAHPDVVVCQEASRPQVIEQLARDTGMTHWGSRRGNSLGYLSRQPLDHVEWIKPRVSRHAFIQIVPAGVPWRIVGVHLSAVHAAWTEQRRRYELRALLLAIQQHQHGPHVLVGDFNTLAPGELLDFNKLPARLRALVWLSGGKVRWRTIQGVLDAGYVDAFRVLQPDLVGYTFPTWDPHVRLDYLFVPQPCVSRVTRCQVFSANHVREASDHFPLLAELS